MSISLSPNARFPTAEEKSSTRPLSDSRRRTETARLLSRARASRGASRTRYEDEVIRINMTVASDVARRYHGRGKYWSPSGAGDEYEGEWRADRPHGHGRYLWRSSGEVYEGEWHDGMRDGKGNAKVCNIE